MPEVSAFPTPTFQYPYQISGITKDSTGAVLGSCIVQLFRTNDDTIQNAVVSDATTGVYTVPARPDTTHYLVAYLAGSPDVTGATLNTVVGA